MKLNYHFEKMVHKVSDESFNQLHLGWLNANRPRVNRALVKAPDPACNSRQGIPTEVEGSVQLPSSLR
jgi:hypothetical protein